MGMRRRHQNPAVPGTSAVPAPRMSRGAVITRTLRTRWWPRFLLAGALLAVIGITLLSSAAQDVAVLAGVLVFLFALLQGMGASNRTPTDLQRSRDRLTILKSSSIGSRREPPVPPSER
jgi:hypothetical protein